MELKFTELHFVVNDNSPSASDLKDFFEQSEDKHELGGTHYLIEKEIVDDDYFWLYARHGSTKPYSPDIYNTKKQQKEDNPKTINQLEPNKQSFALYSVNQKILYRSQPKNIAWLEKYFATGLKNVTIKTFFKSPEEFLKVIKNVEQIKFVIKRNLFSRDKKLMSIFQNIKNLYGLNLPEEFLLSAGFNHAKLTEKFIEAFKKMAGLQVNCELESLLCVGRDDENLETIFNTNAFEKKFTLTVKKNRQGMLDPEDIKQYLITKVKELQK